jgi:hypothetical protein
MGWTRKVPFCSEIRNYKRARLDSWAHEERTHAGGDAIREAEVG